MTAEAAQEAPPLDRAKLLEGARQWLADYVVTQGVLAELESLADAKETELARDEQRLKAVLRRLGIDPGRIIRPGDVKAALDRLEREEGAR